jgi:GTP-binding protein
LIEKDTGSTGKFIKNLHYEMPFLQFAPVIFISAKTHQRIHKVMEAVVKIEEESEKRIPTSELNRFMETVIARRPPTHPTGRHVKIFYITQAAVKPPVFIFFCNTPALITENYRKFLNNQIREMFKFEGVSIKLIFKGRSKEEIEDEQRK